MKMLQTCYGNQLTYSDTDGANWVDVTRGPECWREKRGRSCSIV